MKNPKQPQRAFEKNNVHVLESVKTRIKTVSQRPGMPQMALFYVDTKRGLINYVGDDSVAQSVLQGKCTWEGKPAEGPGIVDMKRVPLALDVDKLGWKRCRELIPQIGLPHPNAKKFWGNEANRPTWWPLDVPFASPSAYDGDVPNKKFLQLEPMRKVINGFIFWVKNEMTKGKVPINQAREDYMNVGEVLRNGADENEKEVDGTILQDVEEENKADDDDTDHDDDDGIEMGNECEGEEDKPINKRKIIADLRSSSVEENLVRGWQVLSSLNELDMPSCPAFGKPIRIPGIPEMDAYQGQGGILGVLAGDQEDLLLRSMAFGFAHYEHFSEQARASGTVLNEEDLYLKDLMRPSALQFSILASALHVQIFEYVDQDIIIINQPCPCVNNGTGALCVTLHKGTWYLLIQAEGRRTRKFKQRSRRTTSSSTQAQRKTNILGIDIYDGDLLSLEPGNWLTDNIVNAALRHYAKETKVKVYDSFCLLLLCLNGPMIRDQTLDLTGYNPKRSYLSRIFDPGRVGLFPVSDNSHWWFYHYNGESIIVHDSLRQGGTGHHHPVTLALQRFIQENTNKEVTIKYGKGPKQNNSDDCGVFLIMTAKDIIERNTMATCKAIQSHGRNILKALVRTYLQMN